MSSKSTPTDSVDEEALVPLQDETMGKAERNQIGNCGKAWGEQGSKERRIKVSHNGLSGKKQRDNKELSRYKKKTLAVRGLDELDCCVLLTRLEDKGFFNMGKDASSQKQDGSKRKPHSSPKKTKLGLQKSSITNHQTLEPKMSQLDALLLWPPMMFEPRKRRMAALNAEAVNSLLLYRDDSGSAKKPPPPPPPSKESSGIEEGSAPIGGAASKSKTEKAAVIERPRKAKRPAAETQDIDWLSLFAPTPRRQASLTAATLLKLSSTQYGSKRQKKGESKTAGPQAGSRDKPARIQQTKSTISPNFDKEGKESKVSPEDPVHPHADSGLQGCFCLCKTENIDMDVKHGSGGQDSPKPSFHCGSALGFSFKTIKEEQVESEVSSCYCCTQERCVQYCHRLALFLQDKTLEEAKPDSLLSEVFHHHHYHHHHHHHHHHPAALSPHSYNCFPSYCVHFTHPDPPPSSVPLTLCSRGSKKPKLLPGSGPQPSGIPHPVYCCTSMEACYGEPCRIKGYSSYTSMIPAIARGGRSFDTADCTKCNREINRDKYPASPKEHSQSSVPIFSSHIPTVPPGRQPAPRTQTPLSLRVPSQAALQVAKESPESAKSPNGSRSGARDASGVASALFPLKREKKQKLVSASIRGQTVAKQPKNCRQKNTNGWQPVGLPFQKEVFSVGEEAPVMRKCFEGIQRDGETIRMRDTVLLKSGPRKKSLPYVAKISALWEEPESGELMMSLFWYYRPEHTQGGRNPGVHCEREIFASRHQDVNSVACIEDKCYVLTLSQYCRFCALVKRCGERVAPSSASLLVPSVTGSAMSTHHCVPDDIDPELVFVCRHVYDFRYGRLLKNLQ